MGPEGVEPPTSRLKGACTAVVLRTRWEHERVVVDGRFFQLR